MKVDFNVTTEDYWHLYKKTTLGSPRMQLIIRGLGWVLLMESIRRTYLLYQQNPNRGLIYLLILTFVLMVSHRTFKWLVLRKKHAILFEKQCIELTSDGMIQINEKEKNHFGWKQINDIQMDRKFIYIHIKEGNVYSIPKRSFETKEKALDFVEWIRLHRAGIKEKQEVE